jgi:CBS domain-containing protein
MTDSKVGSALVIDESEQIVGMLTERDILKYSSDLTCPLGESKVSAIMTTDILVAVPEDDVETMIATMVEGRFRHLPVVDNGMLCGLVSMGDLVKSQLKHVRVENRHLKDYIEGKYPGEAIRK